MSRKPRNGKTLSYTSWKAKTAFVRALNHAKEKKKNACFLHKAI